MKAKFSFTVIFLTTLVVGCQNSASEIPTVLSSTPSQSSALTLIPSSTPTLRPSFTSTVSVTPYPTFPPYSTKQVVFSYSDVGSHSVFDVALNGGTPYSRIILYSDGQLIISGKPYRQKQLSSEEIKQLFSHLEAMGFYSIETNQKHDPTDLLYDFQGQYERSYDGIYNCVTDVVKDREICARSHLREFLLPPMRNILQFLDSYEPKNMSVYQADRLLLGIEAQPQSWYSIDNPEVIPWPVNFPEIETDKKWQMLYVDGGIARQIFSLYGSQADGRIVNSNDIEYYIIVQPVLPHEILSWLR